MPGHRTKIRALGDALMSYSPLPAVRRSLAFLAWFEQEVTRLRCLGLTSEQVDEVVDRARHRAESEPGTRFEDALEDERLAASQRQGWAER